MKIFLAGIMQGSISEAKIHSQDWREPIRQMLRRHLPQAEIYCHFSHHPNSMEYDLPQISETLADGIVRAASCDVLVAYLPGASMGTAIEMYEAALNGAAVLTVTPMASNWVVRVYSDRIFPDIQSLDHFLSSGALEPLLEEKLRNK